MDTPPAFGAITRRYPLELLWTKPSRSGNVLLADRSPAPR
jgi:hypothetical protein